MSNGRNSWVICDNPWCSMWPAKHYHQREKYWEAMTGKTRQEIEAQKAKRYASYEVKRCDFCEEQLDQVFIDGATRMGPWATMCPVCWGRYGYPLGTGSGQMYKRDKQGDWEKITDVGQRTADGVKNWLDEYQ